MTREFYRNTPQFSMDSASDRGTRVHKQTEYLDLYNYTETDDDTEAYVDCYRTFLQVKKPVWLACEWIGYHKLLGYAGTIDRIGYVTPDDGTGVDILDIKTTSDSYPLLLQTQVAGGYKQMLISHGIPVRNCYGLQLHNDGVFRPPIKLDDGYKGFLHCLALHNLVAQEGK